MAAPVGRRANNSGSVWLVTRKTLPNYWRGAVTIADGSKAYVEAETRDGALALVGDLAARVARGEPVRTSRAGTVEEECYAWLAHRATVPDRNGVPFSETSYRTYKSAIRNVISRSRKVKDTDNHRIDSTRMTLNLGKVRVDQLTHRHLQQWLDDLVRAGFSHNYRRSAYRVVTQTLRWLVLDGVLEANPADRVTSPPPRGTTSGRGLEPNEMENVLGAITGDRLELRWLLGFAYGIRPAECVAIRREDVSLTERAPNGSRTGELIIRGQLIRNKYVPRTKSKVERTLPLDEQLVLLFEDHLAKVDAERAQIEADGGIWPMFVQDGVHHDFIFRAEDGTHLTANKDTGRWDAICRKAQVSKAVRYTMRHTSATEMIGDGIDPITAASLLGHTNPTMILTVYGHVRDRGRKAASTAMVSKMLSTQTKAQQRELGDADSLQDLRDQLAELGLDTSELDARIAAQVADDDERRREKRTPRRGSASQDGARR